MGKLIDYLRIRWYYFARSRGWTASVTLSNGMHMEGSTRTIITKPGVFKPTDDNTYKLTKQDGN